MGGGGSHHHYEAPDPQKRVKAVNDKIEGAHTNLNKSISITEDALASEKRHADAEFAEAQRRMDALRRMHEQSEAQAAAEKERLERQLVEKLARINASCEAVAREIEEQRAKAASAKLVLEEKRRLVEEKKREMLDKVEMKRKMLEKLTQTKNDLRRQLEHNTMAATGVDVLGTASKRAVAQLAEMLAMAQKNSGQLRVNLHKCTAQVGELFARVIQPKLSEMKALLEAPDVFSVSSDVLAEIIRPNAPKIAEVVKKRKWDGAKLFLYLQDPRCDRIFGEDGIAEKLFVEDDLDELRSKTIASLNTYGVLLRDVVSAFGDFSEWHEEAEKAKQENQRAIRDAGTEHSRHYAAIGI